MIVWLYNKVDMKAADYTDVHQSGQKDHSHMVRDSLWYVVRVRVRSTSLIENSVRGRVYIVGTLWVRGTSNIIYVCYVICKEKNSVRKSPTSGTLWRMKGSWAYKYRSLHNLSHISNNTNSHDWVFVMVGPQAHHFIKVMFQFPSLIN